MSRNRHLLRLALAAALTAGVAGCGSSDSSSAADFGGSGGAGAPSGGGGTDQGPDFGTGGAGGGGGSGEGASGGASGAPPYLDAGVGSVDNNPIDDLFADPERNPFALLPTEAQDAEGYFDAAIACYATEDGCMASECAAFASCCLAGGFCGEPLDEPSLPRALSFTQCEGLTVAACVENQGSSATAFGPRAPVITSRGLVPNGTASADGGALLGDVVGLVSEQVRIEVQFSLPTDCGATCIESAGVALTEDAGPGEFAGAAVGLLLSGSRDVVNLVIGGQVADSFGAGSDSTEWQLTISPSGMVSVERDGQALGGYPFDAGSLGNARLALFGRNLAGDERSAAIARVSITAALVDNPRGWDVRTPLELVVEGQPDPSLSFGREPSIAESPDGTRVAFELDGVIYVGRGEGPFTVSFDAAGPPPALIPTESFEAGGIASPELATIDGALYVFYTAYDAGGSGHVAWALLDGGQARKGLDPVLSPEGAVVSYEAPTLVVREDLALMVARATYLDGTTELHAFYSNAPLSGWERIIDGTIEALTRNDDAYAELGSPSLIVHNSAYQLYYARRTGTRWTVELAVSDELLLWRPIGESLGPSGAGFDALGARGLDALSNGERIDAVYAGQDGVTFRLGFASRSAPSRTAAQ